jgi:uncharacterized membrane protein
MPEPAISRPVAKRIENLCRWLASASLIILLLGGIAWEAVLAPLRPGGSWLILKVLPLLFPLQGVLHGKRYTYQWSSMLVLLYFAEGAVRAWSDAKPSAWYAGAEVVLTLIFFTAALGFSWITRPSLHPKKNSEP